MRSRIIYPIVITILILFIAGLLLWNGALIPKPYALTEEQYASWQKFQRLEKIKGIIETEFYKPVENEDSLYEGAYKGMVDALEDPYSAYVNEEQYKALMDYSSGTFSGIGVILQETKSDKAFVVTKVLDDSPAQKEGMQSGDTLATIDGVSVADMTMDDIVARIKGENGTSVTLTVLRGEEALSFTLKRREVHEPAVSWEMLDNDIAYVYLAQFSGGSAEELKTKLKDIKAKGAKAFVLDLRFNPGGILSECVDICDFLLPAGRVVYEKDRNDVVQTYKSDAYAFDLPFAVLVNGYSASAAEIAAGAIQVAGRAKIIGSTTYGKGVVQHYYNLDNKTSVKLTASTYYLDNDQTPQGVGVTPDIKIDLPESVTTQAVPLTRENDTQLQSALEILIGK